MSTIDLWEDSAGSLYLTDRDARTGYCGFEVAGEKPQWCAFDRTILHFVVDAEDYGQLADSEFMTPMAPEAVGILYQREHLTGQPERIAAWSAGVLTVSGKPYGDAARWYLGRVVR